MWLGVVWNEDDLERLSDMTEKAWNNGAYDRHASMAEKKTWEFASQVRQVYDRYFKYGFDPRGTYGRLPEPTRRNFTEQVRRDFFNRKGMSLVDRESFPPAFKE